MLVDITNRAPATRSNRGLIKNAGDQNVFIEKGRFKLGEIPPGETRTARFLLR